MLRKWIALGTAALLSTQFACYNTYNVALEELALAQEGGESSTVSMKTKEGEPVIVTANTKLGVTDQKGEYYSISPFNFTLTSAQLVAPDEDLLLSREAIQTGNVKQVSGLRTGLLVAAGVILAVGATVFLTVTADEKKAFGE